MTYIDKVIKKMKSRLFVRTHESVYENAVKYMFINKKTDKLLIVFSAFTGEKRRYNYFTSLTDIKASQLYILDTWGNLGSYYWFEDGKSEPEKLVEGLITSIVKRYGIKEIYTAGTSKGGTAAIYFGLKMKATNIYSGACQYRVGTYLSRDEHISILQGMMGKDTDDVKDLLDRKIEQQFQNGINQECGIHLFYSQKEQTYERQIVPLKADLEKYGYRYEETVNNFPKHDDVGKFFPFYLKEQIQSIL